MFANAMINETKRNVPRAWFLALFGVLTIFGSLERIYYSSMMLQ